ncbi:MAG: inositol monophosphatase [Rhodoferax sp.]|nr:inositol monophosphatase [Rhodoferax sp.]
MTDLMPALEAIVRDAGALMRSAFDAPERPAYSLKGQQDYLTETDGAVEQFVRDQIARHFPGDGVLGEEAGGALDAARLWIVDPIDGTANFARQIPHFCISLGLMVDRQVVAGAIYEPMHDELYIAQLGRGAWLNGKRMRVSTVGELTAATVEVGWSTRIPVATYLDMAGKAAHAGCSVRRAGSGSLGLAYVAAGRTEGYAEPHINAWDVAAGLLLVTEAGGQVNDFWADGGLRVGNQILATNAALATQLSVLTSIPLMP